MFFVPHAKALLFVNDYQAEVFKPEVGLNETVGSDNDIHRAFLQFVYDALLLGRGAETA